MQINLLLAGQAHFNGGDILYQVIMIMLILLVLTMGFSVILPRSRNKNELKRVEEKLDRLIAEVENKNPSNDDRLDIK